MNHKAKNYLYNTISIDSSWVELVGLLMRTKTYEMSMAMTLLQMPVQTKVVCGSVISFILTPLMR